MRDFPKKFHLRFTRCWCYLLQWTATIVPGFTAEEFERGSFHASLPGKLPGPRAGLSQKLSPLGRLSGKTERPAAEKEGLSQLLE